MDFGDLMFSDVFRRKPDIQRMKAGGDVLGLVKALRYRRDSDVRSAAAVALGKIGDKTAVTALVQSLRDKYVRWEAASALERMGQFALEPLVAVLDNDDIYVQRVARRILDRIDDTKKD